MWELERMMLAKTTHEGSKSKLQGALTVMNTMHLKHLKSQFVKVKALLSITKSKVKVNEKLNSKKASSLLKTL